MAAGCQGFDPQDDEKEIEIMAGKMRKVLALALTLSLCAGQLTIPVSAAQRSRAGRASPVMEVTVTPIGNGIKKVSEGKTKENISDTTTVETHTIVTETNAAAHACGRRYHPWRAEGDR